MCYDADCATAKEIEAKFPGLLDEIAEQTIDADSSADLEEGDHGYFWVADRHNMDAVNQILVGVIWVDGVEYSFEAESGNWIGWAWRAIDADAPVANIEDVAPKPTVWALAPKAQVVGQWLARKNGARDLLILWDHFIQRDELKDLPNNFAYDRHFSPGMTTNTYYKSKADAVGMELVPKDEADDLRARLRASQASEVGDEV